MDGRSEEEADQSLIAIGTHEPAIGPPQSRRGRARTQTLWMLASVTEAPGTAGADTTQTTYYLDGRPDATTDARSDG